MMHCQDTPQFTLCVRGASPTLVRVLGDACSDGNRFVTHERSTIEVFLECFRQAHQNTFGILEVVTAVEFVVLGMPSALHETWTEEKDA